MDPAEDLATIVAIIVAGMAVPVVIALGFHDLLALYLTGFQFTLLLGVVYGLVCWHRITTDDLDRVNVVLASVVFPILVALAILIIGISMEEFHSGFRYLFLDFGDLFAYAATFGLAGITAAVIDRTFERRASASDWIPSSQTAALATIGVLVLIIVTGGVIGHLTASTAAVTAFEPDTTQYGKPVLNVTVESDPTELRLVVTAPDDSMTTHRITRADLREGSVTIPIEYWEFDASEPPAGTYHVRVTSIAGITVDAASHTVETAPTPSLVDTAAARPGDELDIDPPADTIIYGPGDDSRTRVAVVLQNDGDLPARFYVQISTDDERIASREIPIEPGQQGVNIFELSDAEVDRIHAESDGTVSVEIAYGDERITTTIELPRA